MAKSHPVDVKEMWYACPQVGNEILTVIKSVLY